MAGLNAYSQLTLLELAKRKDPDGNLAAIAEILNEENEWLMDAIWKEANDTFQHKVTRRSSLPSGSWRKINAGVSKEASRTIEAMEALGMLESYSYVDVALVEAAGNQKEFRMDEAYAFIEGLGQTLSSTFIYGDQGTDPEKFTGLAPRMNALATTNNVLDAGGSGGDTTSIFVVQWGPTRVFMAYPKSDPYAGINHEDMGKQLVEDASSNPYQVFVDHFRIKCGLVVKDPRCIGRIANIEVTGTSNIFNENDLITLLNRLPNAGRGAVIYVEKEVKTQGEIALKDKTNVWWSSRKGEGLAGEEWLYFRGNPIRLVDQIVTTETAVA